MNRIVLAVFALLLAPRALAQDVKLISTADLSAKLKGSGVLLLVDSRTETEFAEGHLPGAALVPAKKTAEKLPGLSATKDRLVVFYCNGPDCTKSRKAYKAAAAIGYSNLREYNEGLPAWKAAGLQVDGAPLPAFALPPGLKPAELKALLAGPGAPQVIDVRDADEYAAFRLAGTSNIPVDVMNKRAGEIKAGPIVIVDHAGHQVKVASRVLARLGHTDLKWLDGGVLAWSDAGLPTEGK